MKKILLLTILGMGILSVSAQDQLRCPPGEHTTQTPAFKERANAPDFTTTFTNGTSANLYTTLNQGNSVLLNFFFVG